MSHCFGQLQRQDARHRGEAEKVIAKDRAGENRLLER
jgi:hypothetical protein